MPLGKDEITKEMNNLGKSTNRSNQMADAFSAMNTPKDLKRDALKATSNLSISVPAETYVKMVKLMDYFGITSQSKFFKQMTNVLYQQTFKRDKVTLDEVRYVESKTKTAFKHALSASLKR